MQAKCKKLCILRAAHITKNSWRPGDAERTASVEELDRNSLLQLLLREIAGGKRNDLPANDKKAWVAKAENIVKEAEKCGKVE